MTPLPFFTKKKKPEAGLSEAKKAAPEGGEPRPAPQSGAGREVGLQVQAIAGVLRSPRMTEKANRGAERGEYVFEVFPKTNKVQVKQAVEKTYKVNVVNVSMVNLPSKTKRIGRRMGKTGAVRKAIVRLQKGQTIELMPQK